MASIRELHHQLVSKERSAVEITQEALNRIAALEPKLHSFLYVTADQALKQASLVDAKIAAGEEIGLLAGIPVGIKDNMCTQGIPTTCASKILENFVPPYESTVTQKLADAGTRGLHGGPGKLASNRKARLVEHALSTRLVTETDLALLDAGVGDDAGHDNRGT